MHLLRTVLITAAALTLSLGSAQAETLRLLTWSDYAPANVIAQFEKETGIKVKVTITNNEDMISKLRATGGLGLISRNPARTALSVRKLITTFTNRWI